MVFDVVSRVEDFAGPLARRVYAGKTFCFWQDQAFAFGTVMWGRPLDAHVDEMIPFLEVGIDPRFAGHVSFVDGRSIESVDALAFGKLLAYLVTRRHAWGPNIERQAILHPGGLVGAIIAGALHVARPPYPFECFTSSAEAFAWCGATHLHAGVETMRASRIATPAIALEVRSFLERRGLGSASTVARALGLSQRTFQRRLRDAGTTFREERDRYLSMQIEDLLSGTELDLDAIAAHVGLSSASHLVAHFRATHDTTPGAWRAQRRPG